MDNFVLLLALIVLILVPGITVLPLSSLEEQSNEIDKGNETAAGEKDIAYFSNETLTNNALDEVNKVVKWNWFLHFIDKFNKNSRHYESASPFETSTSHDRSEAHRLKRSSGWPDRDKCCQTFVFARKINNFTNENGSWEVIHFKDQDQLVTTGVCGVGSGCGCQCGQVKLTRYMLVRNPGLGASARWEFQPYEVDGYCKCLSLP